MIKLDKRLFTAITVMATSLSFQAKAQKTDTVSSFSISGYIDAYYAYYSDSVGAGNFQKFPAISPRSNSPSLNIARLSFQYNAEKVRGTAVLHFGDIAAAVWAPAPYTNIMEANVGVKLCNKVWLDAGFFKPHFGTEMFLPSENITSSLAVGTTYEPYFQSGLRLNIDPTPKLKINVFLLNGYGVFIDNNNKKSLGLGVAYAFTDNMGIGYTNYLGDDAPEGATTNHLRFSQNLFFNYQNNRIKLLVGGNVAIQQNSKLSNGTETAAMCSALASFRVQVVNKFALYARAEVFQDPDGFLSTVITDNAGNMTGYKLWGITAGAEFKPVDGAYVRLEGRRLQMAEDQYIYTRDALLYNYRYEVMVNAGISFDLLRSIKTRISGGSQQPGSGDNDE